MALDPEEIKRKRQLRQQQREKQKKIMRILLILIPVLIILILLIFVLVVLILVLIIILILVLILIVVLIVLVLVLLVLVLLLLVLLILEHLLCIDIILLGIHIPRIPQKRFLESIHSTLPILLSNSHITEIIIIISCLLHRRCNLPYPLKRRLGLLHILLTIKIARQIVIRSHRKRILHKSLSVIYIGLPVIPLLEITVTTTHITPVHLGPHLRSRHQQ